jgi:hypothetical protein
MEENEADSQGQEEMMFIAFVKEGAVMKIDH